ncbi:hypothetical protein AQUCO_00900443v1 [Aquilegia coerulea]|uniref:Uncharacterized protein n=1 Tax=Aquilegia coerulea TaxID=218851 RepID=A0A2G5EDL7_AQUCA|nr:hypothetical protein AQUCO_00900443v1 [Aquilegia coerulea]
MDKYNEDEFQSVTVNLAQPRYTPPPLAKLVNVIGSLYCEQYPVDLSMKYGTSGNEGYDYVVVDNVSRNTIFNINQVFFSFRGKRALLDSAGNPLVTIQRKTIFGSRWQVYKGDSTDDNDLLFKVEKSCMRESSWTNLDVFLASNIEENICDFKIKGGYTWERSCVVYLGHSSVDIAQMHQKCDSWNWRGEINGFNVVNVNPHVDYAFIIALIMIFNAVNPRDHHGDTHDRISSCEPAKDISSCESNGVVCCKCD